MADNEKQRLLIRWLQGEDPGSPPTSQPNVLHGYEAPQHAGRDDMHPFFRSLTTGWNDAVRGIGDSIYGMPDYNDPVVRERKAQTSSGIPAHVLAGTIIPNLQQALKSNPSDARSAELLRRYEADLENYRTWTKPPETKWRPR